MLSVNSFDDYPMSWRPELKKSKTPLYQSLARQLENDIDSGELLPGTKLPPQRELADFLGVNLSTVSRAFKLCSDKGLLTGSVGSGTYVSYSSLTKLTDTPNKTLIRLDAMTPETIEPAEMINLLQRMITESDNARLMQYELSSEAWQQEAACRLLSRAGCTARPDELLTACGGQNAIAVILAGLFKRGDRLGVDPLTYPGLKSAAKLFGVQLVPIEQENGHMSEQGIISAVKNDGIRALFVMPDYQNPTAYIMSASERQMVASAARKNDLIVIEDGICKLLAGKSSSIHDLAPENTIFTLSLSKTISPALRTAYIAAPPRYHRPLDEAIYGIDLSQSALLTELASRLIASHELDSLLSRRIDGIEKRNELVDIILEDFTVRGDHHALSRWLVLPDGMNSLQFEHEAARQGVCVYGAEHFAVGRKIPEEGARLAICAPESPEQLERALVIIRDILK